MKITKYVLILVGLILVFATAVFVSPNHAYAASIVSDDFNAYTNGSIVGQGGWSGYANGEKFVVQGAEGAKAVYSNGDGDTVITKSGIPLSDGRQAVYIKTKNRSSWGTYENGNVQIRVSKGPWASGGLPFATVSFTSDGKVTYNLRKDFSFATYNDDEWTLLEIEWRSSDKTARYRVNNGTWTNWDTFSGSNSFTDFDNVGFDVISGGSGGAYFDGLSSIPSPPPPSPPPAAPPPPPPLPPPPYLPAQTPRITATSSSCLDTNQPYINIDWTDSPGATNYRVNRDGVDVASTETASSWRDSQVSNGATYTYKVAAQGPGGESSWSNQVSYTAANCAPTPPPPPPAPTPPPPPSCTADIWSCSEWNSCSLSGIQSRNCTKSFDCPNAETAPPITNQYCEPPNRPTPQTPPQDNFDDASIQDLIIKATVKLVCPLDARQASQGSGTVIDPSGVVLTNKHVVSGTLGCLVGFIDDFNDEPYFGERQIADIVKVSPSEDIAVLKIQNPQNRRLQYIDITRSGSRPRLGNKISIYGYPAKFGTKITYTSGDYSGTDGSYFKTTAIIDSGNSGGGAYFKDGTFIGIPSGVIRGKLNALGYVLSINSVNAWLGNPTSYAYGGKSNNEYSRVSSVLEDIDLKKLDSLELVVPGIKENKATPSVSKPSPSDTKKEPPPKIEKESPSQIAAKESPTNESVNKPQVEGKPKASWIKRFFFWIANLF